MTKALLFDFGGVLVDIDFDLAFEKFESLSSLSAQDIRQRFQMDEMYKKHEIGQVGWTEYAQHLRVRFSLDANDIEITQAWNAIFTDEITETTEAIKRVKDKIRCFMFSNTNQTHHDFWADRYSKVVELFDHVFVSSQIGQRKPDLAAFEAIARAIDCELGDILFFDDTIENIQGALDAGMQAVLVKTPLDVTTELTQLNLL